MKKRLRKKRGKKYLKMMDRVFSMPKWKLPEGAGHVFTCDLMELPLFKDLN